MTKLVKINRTGLAHWCPACDSGHEINVGGVNSSGARWAFNGNAQCPTFSPSINLKINTPDMGADYQPDIASTVCHYFISGGKIQYCADCTHELRGQTVDLPDIPAGKYMSCEPA